MEETMSAAEVKDACGAEEEQGFDAPFATYTWKHWIEMQTTIVQCLTRYQRAIEAHQALPRQWWFSICRESQPRC
jgi:hypothetical protein